MTKAYGTTAADQPIAEMEIQRRNLEDTDVKIEIMYCGICHSDLHAAKNDWGGSHYPMVPGHEIIGKVVQTGAKVSNHQIGAYVGVGCIVDSCRTCQYCEQGDEQFCENGWTVVFDCPDKKHGGLTFGGFSESIIVDQNYIVSIPAGLDLASAAPILCAGITVYSPLSHWKISSGMKVGIIGMGGLGHMAIKIAKAMGAEVTVYTRSESKINDALSLGADHVVISTDKQAMKTSPKQNFFLDTVSGPHNVNSFIRKLKVDGSMVLVGLPNEPIEINPFNIVSGRKSFSGSNIGGISETQEVLDFCAKHHISAEIEEIKPNQINEAFERLEKGDVKYRFVVKLND